MKLDSLKNFLKPYSIYRERKTTINGSFASAVVPREAYAGQRVAAAIALLGQDPGGELLCVYCGASARTWDHLVPKVKNGLPYGPGHQIGNLVPCCRDCNSSKGGKDWRTFVAIKEPDADAQVALIERLSRYQAQFTCAIPAPYEADPELWTEFLALRDSILELMKKADALAAKMECSRADQTPAR